MGVNPYLKRHEDLLCEALHNIVIEVPYYKKVIPLVKPGDEYSSGNKSYKLTRGTVSVLDGGKVCSKDVIVSIMGSYNRSLPVLISGFPFYKEGVEIAREVKLSEQRKAEEEERKRKEAEEKELEAVRKAQSRRDSEKARLKEIKELIESNKYSVDKDILLKKINYFKDDELYCDICSRKEGKIGVKYPLSVREGYYMFNRNMHGRLSGKVVYLERVFSSSGEFLCWSVRGENILASSKSGNLYRTLYLSTDKDEALNFLNNEVLGSGVVIRLGENSFANIEDISDSFRDITVSFKMSGIKYTTYTVRYIKECKKIVSERLPIGWGAREAFLFLKEIMLKLNCPNLLRKSNHKYVIYSILNDEIIIDEDRIIDVCYSMEDAKRIISKRKGAKFLIVEFSDESIVGQWKSLSGHLYKIA